MIALICAPFISVPVASQMQVAAAAAAATGQPLLAPAPMPQFVPYPQAHAQAAYQQQYHAPMVSGPFHRRPQKYSSIGEN